METEESAVPRSPGSRKASKRNAEGGKGSEAAGPTLSSQDAAGCRTGSALLVAQETRERTLARSPERVLPAQLMCLTKLAVSGGKGTSKKGQIAWAFLREGTEPLWGTER